MTEKNLTNKKFREEIEAIYSKMTTDLESIAKEIIALLDDVFYSILQSENEKYNLLHNVGLKEGKYYSISSRIKESKSLGEKLVRKSDLLKIKSECNGEILVEKISEFLKGRYTDLIGIKILGDLHFDEVNIFKLIEENSAFFEDRYSKIIFKEISQQPQPMENGLDIYRIDCQYTKKISPFTVYNFELQIKSQLMSAWADMEHQQYYKNFIFNPIRNTSQPIMNEVGKLIYQTEELLIKIRNSEKEYSEIQERLDFTATLGDIYSEFIQNSLTISAEPMLTNVSGALYMLNDIIEPDEEAIRKIIKSGFLYTPPAIEGGEHSHYIALRDTDFQIQILEAISLLWYKSKNKFCGEFSYDDYISQFNEHFLDGLIRTFKLEALADNFKCFWYMLFKEINVSDVYLSISKYYEISSFFRQVHDEWEKSFGELLEQTSEDQSKDEDGDEIENEEDFDDNSEPNLHEGLLAINLVFALKKLYKKYDTYQLGHKYQISIENIDYPIIRTKLEELFKTLIASFDKSQHPLLNDVQEVCISLIKR
ncbi:hypothetical protein [Pseudalkalibacillus caeni]|uniref:RelA/SpoT domain-containing protein n=1 Tax=Exobacillus caeni TaxID=2574798 RepID=A0A5R9EVQ2_9BACL|nr:hypothetical protein [Pseudalkalibacillus caeni]TLS35302.1 hypothetical protein FCL54_21190 [Pseudalkalibacillus caeni]